MTYYLILTTALHLAILAAATTRLTLRERISSPARLAWFIVILSIPVGGFATYLLIGEKRLSRHLRARHTSLSRDAAALASAPGSSAYDQLAPEDAKLFRYGTSINGFSPVGGNSATLAPDAASARAGIIADIDAARDSVELLYYIWLTDRTGTDTAHALIRAARRGVRCRVMADHMGSRHLIRSALWREMAAAGVETRIALPPETIVGLPIVTRFDLRNHRKITLIDGRIAWVGSQNCADPEFSPKARFGPWIDIMLRVQGPVVNQIRQIFASDWCLFGPGEPGEFPAQAAPVSGGFIAQARGTGPLERADSSTQMFCSLFERARSELVLTTPYFVPDIPLQQALKSAARRGVQVSLVLPRRNDSRIVQAASRGNYILLLKAGVRIFEHGPGLLHAKTLTADGEITFLGSSNLDMRSFDLNFENDLLIADPGITAQVRARQLEHLAQSQEVTLEEVFAWPARRRAWNNVVETLGPIL
ncbi:cardiolipin synthase [Marimonas lutisalis]|uniref:cardiolipin synthase n=1 Tax=Marimonas lutisalis TaxID=2545756 RepID=UPI0018736288|nr:cardiolipin synthase [Marimonas lutisalis]